MTVTYIFGADPGLSGGIAFLPIEDPDFVSAEPMPVAGGEIDIVTLANRIRQMRPSLAIIEQVGARPGQGVASMFKFGTGYGMIRGVVTGLGVPLHLVTPGKWKRYFGLDADKDKARALALRYWPKSTAFSRKKDDGPAEAALLCRYLAETLPGLLGGGND